MCIRDSPPLPRGSLSYFDRSFLSGSWKIGGTYILGRSYFLGPFLFSLSVSFPIFTGPPFLFTCVALPIYIHRSTHTPGRILKVKNVFRFTLDAKSAPEALATTIRILLMFSIVLAHRRRTVEWVRQPTRSGAPPDHSWPPPDHSWPPP